MIIAGNEFRQFIALTEEQARSVEDEMVAGSQVVKLHETGVVFRLTGSWIARGEDDARRMVGHAMGLHICSQDNWHPTRRQCACTRRDPTLDPLVKAGLKPKPKLIEAGGVNDKWKEMTCFLQTYFFCSKQYMVESSRDIPDPTRWACQHCLKESKVEAKPLRKDVINPRGVDLSDIPF